jgi:hypothetical protein
MLWSTIDAGVIISSWKLENARGVATWMMYVALEAPSSKEPATVMSGISMNSRVLFLMCCGYFFSRNCWDFLAERKTVYTL